MPKHVLKSDGQKKDDQPGGHFSQKDDGGFEDHAIRIRNIPMIANDASNISLFQNMLYLNFCVSFGLCLAAGFGAVIFVGCQLPKLMDQYEPASLRGSPLFDFVYLAGFQLFLWLVWFKDADKRKFAFFSALFCSGCLVMALWSMYLNPELGFGIPLPAVIGIFSYFFLSNFLFALAGSSLH